MRKDGAKRDQIGSHTDSGGRTANMFGEEEEPGRRLLWRLGAWAVTTVLAVATAAWINNTSAGLRRERVAYNEFSRQAQQIEAIAKNAQDETKRLSSAINILNTDRDRLYTRVTSIERGLDSVTGSIAKQVSSPSWPTIAPAAVLSTPPLVSGVSTSLANLSDEVRNIHIDQPHQEMAPQEHAAPSPSPPPVAAPTKPSETMAVPLPGQKADPQATAAPQQTALPAAVANTPVPATSSPNASLVQRTDFAVDLGTANSVEGLRALWRGGIKGWPALIGSLQPLIVVKERHDGLGLQLHLVAGPLNDAAAAARLCASLVASRHPCETTVFDGQLLPLNTLAATTPAVPVREKSRRKSRSQPEKPVEEAQRPQQQPQQQPSSPPPPQQPQQQSGGLMSVFGNR